MVRRLGLLLWGSIFLLPLLSPASGHVAKFDDPGNTPETAILIGDATKSWAYFGQLETDQEHWYTFRLQAGDELYISASVPAQRDATPTVWLFGPGLEGDPGPLAPAGTRSFQIPAQDQLGIEPFSPIALRTVAEWRGEAPASGTYFIHVSTPEATPYNLGIGARESFTPIEWIGTPIYRIGIQAWGGIPWPVTMAGEALGFLGAITWAARRPLEWRHRVGFAAAGCIAGSALTALLLSTIAAVRGGVSGGLVIPLFLGAAALGIGVGTWRHVAADKNRWMSLAWAGGALLLWAGLLLGPAFLLAWAAWPARTANQP